MKVANYYTPILLVSMALMQATSLFAFSDFTDGTEIGLSLPPTANEDYWPVQEPYRHDSYGNFIGFPEDRGVVGVQNWIDHCKDPSMRSSHLCGAGWEQDEWVHFFGFWQKNGRQYLNGRIVLNDLPKKLRGSFPSKLLMLGLLVCRPGQLKSMNALAKSTVNFVTTLKGPRVKSVVCGGTIKLN